MADDTTDAVKDRFAQRFDNEDQSENAESEQTDHSDTQVKNDTQAENEQRSKNAETANIKAEWTNHSVYLEDDLASQLSRSYKRLDLELDEQYDLSIKKTRHYYPLIVKLGLDRLGELESEDIKEELEHIDS